MAQKSFLHYFAIRTIVVWDYATARERRLVVTRDASSIIYSFFVVVVASSVRHTIRPRNVLSIVLFD